MIVGCVYLGVGYCFVYVYQVFVFVECVQEYGYCVDVECVCVDLYQVVQYVCDFVEQYVDVLCVFWYFDVEQFFDCEYVVVFVDYY